MDTRYTQIMAYLFEFGVVSFLVFAFAEILKPGIVYRYFDLLWYGTAVIVMGIIWYFMKRS